MAAADHPREVANDHRLVETPDRGGLGDGEAAVNQTRRPLLGRHVSRCRIGAATCDEGATTTVPDLWPGEGSAGLVPGPVVLVLAAASARGLGSEARG